MAKGIMYIDGQRVPFGMGTGAATIFGTTGGVAEAVARRVVEDLSLIHISEPTRP